jgi:hypothetical protein
VDGHRVQVREGRGTWRGAVETYFRAGPERIRAAGEIDGKVVLDGVQSRAPAQLAGLLGISHERNYAAGPGEPGWLVLIRSRMPRRPAFRP